MPQNKKKLSTPQRSHTIDSLKHTDKRANIPTEELRDFIADDEKAPRTMLYPRDPSLDPQLVWKGKDEQDQADLAVPAVPIYIQEHIKPQNIIELVRAESKKDEPFQPMLFNDFNGLDFEERVDFYHHQQNWTNRMILGNSLMVMTSLAEKEGLKGQVQMIYIDPPYGIKFGSNWQVSTRKRDVKDGKVEDATRQPEQIKAFRDTWELGIHSYLAYLRDRLVVARELLTETGSVFVQIGDENVHLVRSILDEVFGSENIVSQIPFKKTGGQSSNELAGVCDYLLWYVKKREAVKYRQLYFAKSPGEEGAKQYNWIELENQERRPMTSDEANSGIPKNAIIFQPYPLVSMGASKSDKPFHWQGQKYLPSPNRHWSVTNNGLERVALADRLLGIGNTLRLINYLSDYPVAPYTNLWTDTQTSGFASDRVYVVQTLPTVIERCMLMTTDPGDLVLDPTCGSGTTAYVAEQWGRRWITIDTSRVSIALARTRLMAGRFPYYTLSDSPEGTLKEAEVTGILPPTPLPSTGGDIKKGFVYKRVPHITLKAIANNEEIDEIHTRWEAPLEELRAEINRLSGKQFQAWEVPHEVPKDLTGLRDLSGLLSKYWDMRRKRQSEIDASIARRADSELLYDQPYEDNKRLRVTGPFTVESLSPHRVLSADPTDAAEQTTSVDGFVHMIIENLKKAGVQNTYKNERLKFDRLEPFAGLYLHAAGEYTEAGAGKRVAVHIGPENGTVGPNDIKEAAKEAVQGLGFDLLIICGFAFDPQASEEIKRYGTLTVLPTRMNPDLAMGDELLKKTGAGNLFMVFGEPDLSLDPAPDGRLTVTIHGVDVYDPTTGEIRSNSTDDIACWFIDTDYNGELFIVRQAYFSGADEPYDKLKRALRSEIDESAWSALYQTTSYPFEKPESGKIAVKVINHYGDEVLQVYEI